MPGRNVVKNYTEDTYYHVYNRGVEKRTIFLDEQDFRVFLNLLKRHLSENTQHDNRGIAYESYSGKIELLAFCLMPNHFHLLFYLEKDVASVPELMRKIAGTYTTYFNKKYQRVGHLFQGVYKASVIDRDNYLQHISRYIHLNPEDYKHWPFSSYPYYVGGAGADWLKTEKVLAIFDGQVKAYVEFIDDYQYQRRVLKEIKHQLADQ